LIQSDDLLREQAYLVARGVRLLALVGSCEPCEVAGMPHHLLTRASGHAVIPFVSPRGIAGYASHAWVVDLVTWADSAPRIQRDRIFGLLLGYDPESIRQFEELGSTLGPFDRGEGGHESIPPEQPVWEVWRNRGRRYVSRRRQWDVQTFG
jgi:hypothetical protein